MESCRYFFCIWENSLVSRKNSYKLAPSLLMIVEELERYSLLKKGFSFSNQAVYLRPQRI